VFLLPRQGGKKSCELGVLRGTFYILGQVLYAKALTMPV
jgi:hypothetical protein